jgi:NAD(P)-dependent dehydrogenase (short-subunit alcohol dehydrogenase family)
MWTTIELARASFRVIATMRNVAKRAALDAAAAQAGVASGIELRALDVTQFASLPAIVSEIVRDHGHIDVLVNNAGFSMAGFAEDVTLEELREQLETNFFGHIAITRAVLPYMRRQRSGHIIMMSSMSGLTGQPMLSSYCASKFALEGWSESLRLETHALGIRVVLVEPGAFESNIWEKNVRIGKAVMDPASPNYQRALRFRDYALKKVHKRDPRQVGRLVARIAQMPNPRLRYRVGTDAHLVVWLRRLLPWNQYERLVGRAVGID